MAQDVKATDTPFTRKIALTYEEQQDITYALRREIQRKEDAYREIHADARFASFTEHDLGIPQLQQLHNRIDSLDL